MLALVVSVPAVEAELASDALWALGVVAIEERDSVIPTQDHLVELWTSLGDDVAAVRRATGGFPARWRWRLIEVDEAVADTWRVHAVPTWVETDLVVCPAWVSFDPPADVQVIRIEPGATFGLGDHPTTVLALRALRHTVFDGATVLDVGCGSGVLAVAAALFGAARVDAIDVSPAAPAITDQNAAANGVAGAVSASTTALADVDGPYDVVVANILAPTLIELAPQLQRVTSPSGVLIISGVLADRHSHVEEALAPMRSIDRDVHGVWAAITLRW
jgi:ribosomal protein L11 methyltransferase